MKQKAFTLMELMIVIVIIGILSAVGMVMFGGQSEKAKNAVIKSNHKNVVKLLATDVMKCELEGSYDRLVYFNNKTKNYSCSGSDYTAFDTSIVSRHFMYLGIKNPLIKSSKTSATDIIWDERAVWVGSNNEAGKTFIYAEKIGNNYYYTIKSTLIDGTKIEDTVQYR